MNLLNRSKIVNLNEEQQLLLRESLNSNYSITNEADMQNHINARLTNFREQIIPWLSSVKKLNGLRILEIGCGTGASTVALAEQGAKVTGVDILPGSLKVAEDRLKLHGLNATLLQANATELKEKLAGQKFDMIIFFATLEHMTHSERMKAMKDTWDMLGKGGLWCVIEAPNRLSCFDDHSALLPFFYWLPNDLAFDYTRLSPRDSFKDAYRDYSAENELEFLRRGRGVSYHEFDLTLGISARLNVVSSLGQFQKQKPLTVMEYMRPFGPTGLSPAFYEPYLNLIIKK